MQTKKNQKQTQDNIWVKKKSEKIETKSYTCNTEFSSKNFKFFKNFGLPTS